MELPQNRIFMTLYMGVLVGVFSLGGALLLRGENLLFSLLGLMGGGTIGALVVIQESTLIGSLYGGFVGIPLSLVLLFVSPLYSLYALFGSFILGALIGYFNPQLVQTAPPAVNSSEN